MAQLADAVQGFVSLLARLMIAAIFLASAIGNKIPQFAGRRGGRSTRCGSSGCSRFRGHSVRGLRRMCFG